MSSIFSCIIIPFILLIGITVNAQECQPNWLSTDGNKIIDINGEQVILAGVNWFGFENSSRIPNGLWRRDTESMLQQVQGLGFNCLRIPWSNDNLFTNEGLSEKDSFLFVGTDPLTGVSPSNSSFTQGVTTPIEVLDFIVNWCQENDMKIILDNHSRIRDNFQNEFVWYTDSFSHEQWIEDWKILAERYKNNSAVVGMDLNNEPHGNRAKGGLFSTWGSGDPTNDWKMAAEECGNAILEVNPNVLIVIEGVTEYVRPEDGFGTNYWDGGNLQGVRDHKVKLSDNTKLVYSPHEYGYTVFNQPWFQTPDFPGNLEGIWEENFNFINSEEIAPLLVGEFGIRDLGSPDEIWLTEFVKFIEKEKLSYTYWSLNPNSTDTGGILQDDWTSINQWKMDYLIPTLSSPIPSCLVKEGEEPEVETPPVVVAPPVEEEPEVETPPVVVAPPVEEEPEVETPPVVVAPPVEEEPEEETPPVVVVPPVEEEPEVETPPVVVAPPIEEEPEVETPPVVLVPPVEEEEPIVVTPPVISTPISGGESEVIIPSVGEEEGLVIIDNEESITDENVDTEIEEVEINIYPNPTSNMINLKGDFEEFRLYDLSGQLINDITPNVSEEGSTYDLSRLSSNIYLAVITTGRVTKTLKIIKK